MEPGSSKRWGVLRSAKDLDHLLKPRTEETPETAVDPPPERKKAEEEPEWSVPPGVETPEACLETLCAVVNGRLRPGRKRRDARLVAAWVSTRAQTLIQAGLEKRKTVDAIVQNIALRVQACEEEGGAEWSHEVAKTGATFIRFVVNVLSAEERAMTSLKTRSAASAMGASEAMAASAKDLQERHIGKQKVALRGAKAMGGRTPVTKGDVLRDFVKEVHPLGKVAKALHEASSLASTALESTPGFEVNTLALDKVQEGASHLARRDTFGGCTSLEEARKDLVACATMAQGAAMVRAAVERAKRALKDRARVYASGGGAVGVVEEERDDEDLYKGPATPESMAALARASARGQRRGTGPGTGSSRPGSEEVLHETKEIYSTLGEVLQILDLAYRKVKAAHVRGDRILMSLTIRDAHIQAVMEEEKAKAREAWRETFFSLLDSSLVDLSARSREDLGSTVALSEALARWRVPLATLGALEQRGAGGVTDTSKGLLEAMLKAEKVVPGLVKGLFAVDRGLWVVSAVGGMVRATKPFLFLPSLA